MYLRLQTIVNVSQKSHSDTATHPSTFCSLGFFAVVDDRDIEKFIIRQPPIGEKDDYDSENSWISGVRWAPQQQQKKEERRWEVGGGRVEREVKCKCDRR